APAVVSVSPARPDPVRAPAASPAVAAPPGNAGETVEVIGLAGRAATAVVGRTDGQRAPAAETGSPPEPQAPPPDCPFLPGCRFVPCVGGGGGETWLVQTPAGARRLGRFVQGLGSLGDDQAALRRLLQLAHPRLPALEAVAIEPGRVLLLSDVAEHSLRDR